MRFWWGRGERTDVGWDTELAIPIATYFSMGIVGFVFVICCFLFGWFIWLQRFLGHGTFREWWKLYVVWITRNWPLIPILGLGIFITLPQLALWIRLTKEQVLKAWLPYDLGVILYRVFGIKQRPSQNVNFDMHLKGNSESYNAQRRADVDRLLERED